MQRADAELALAEQAVHDLVETGPRVVRLGFLHSFGTWLAPRLIQQARAQDPALTFELQQGAADTISALVVDGSLDLAITSPRPSRDQLSWRLLQRQSVVLALPQRHPLAAQRAVSLSALRDEPIVSMPSEYGMRGILEDACESAGFAPRIAVECQEADTVAGLVAAGMGLGLLPAEEAPRYPPGLVVRPLTGADLGRDIGLIWSRRRPLPQAAQTVRDLVPAGPGDERLR